MLCLKLAIQNTEIETFKHSTNKQPGPQSSAHAFYTPMRDWKPVTMMPK